jgi:hypothetical protein
MFQAADVAAGLFQVLPESVAQIGRVGRLRHLSKSLDDTVLGVVSVRRNVQEPMHTAQISVFEGFISTDHHIV